VVAVNLGLKAENVHIVFNDNRSNYAPKSAEQLQRILEIYHEIKGIKPKVRNRSWFERRRRVPL
jgi:hypothetical protein